MQSFDGTEKSNIAKFLMQNCVYSRYKQDFILDQDLRQAYDLYCAQNNITWQQKGRIIGSQELLAVKATRALNITLTYLKGVAMQPVILTQATQKPEFDHGFVRTPIKLDHVDQT